MATFFGSLVIGLLNSWQIALLTLATGPFIVAAGGISNVFLHRLAENIQDAYGEAASVAEQVFHLLDMLYNACIPALNNPCKLLSLSTQAARAR
jgi:ATP-binding cassette, subfamily B (MDR/TAP), member 1